MSGDGARPYEPGNALAFEEDVARAWVRQQRIARRPRWLKVAVSRNAGSARRDLQVGLVVQRLEAVGSERAGVEVTRRLREREHRGQHELDETLALVASRTRHETQWSSAMSRSRHSPEHNMRNAGVDALY